MTGMTRSGALLLIVLAATLVGCAAPPGQPTAWVSREWVDYALVDGTAPRDGQLVSNAPRGVYP